MEASTRPSSKDVLELESGFPTAHQEKENLLSRGHISSPDEPVDYQQDRRQKMAPCHRVLLALAVCLVVTLSLVSAVPSSTWNRLPCPHHRGFASHHYANPGLAAEAAAAAARNGGSISDSREASTHGSDETAFSCLLNAVSPESLHEVLHRFFPNRFKDGVYESDQSAMEAVHRADPPLATSLVRIAKRQNGTDPTTTTTTGPTTSPRTTTTLPTTTSTTSNPTTTSNQPTQNTDTTTPKTSSTPTSHSSKPITTTFTSTASNGDVTIVTRTSFVNADPAETTGGQAEGSLQTGAAVPRSRNKAVEAVAGAVIGGLFFL